METMNLFDSGDEMMVPILSSAPEDDPPYQIDEPEKKIKKITKEKNKSKHQKSEEMDSTPIADIMMDTTPGGMINDGSFMGAAVQPMMKQAPQAKAPKEKVVAAKYPFDMTEAQVEALLAGVVGVIGFSQTVQDKLAGFVPNFIDVNTGGSSMTGMLASALVIAILFYFSRKFLLKK
jgi:hypothetical protein